MGADFYGANYTQFFLKGTSKNSSNTQRLALSDEILKEP